MVYHFAPFGNEIQYLDGVIETAVGTKYDLGNKRFIKRILHFTGLPHFGARIRAFYIQKFIAKLPKYMRVLDAGCGIGLNTFLVSKRGNSVFGIDTDTQKIRLAKKMARRIEPENIHFRVMDIRHMNFRNEQFDCVMCIEVLEHIQEDSRALKEISRVLKSDGTLLLSVPGKGFISLRNQQQKKHVRQGYSFSQIKKMLDKTNFQLVTTVGIEHTWIGWLVRFINDEIHVHSLALTTLLFPLFYPLAILDGFLPIFITPNNWFIVARKLKN